MQSHNRFCISEFVSLSNRKTSKPSVVWLKSFLSTYPGWRVATGHTCFTAVISPFDPSSSQSCAVGELHVFVCTFAPSFRKETSQPQHFGPFGTMCTAWAWIFTFSGAKAEVWAALIMNTQDALWEYITNVLTAVRELHRWQTQTLNYKCSHEQMSGHGWATETSAERQKNPVSTLRKSSGGETFFVLFSEQLQTWTLESKNNRYHKCKGLQYWCNWQILFIYVSTLLAEQQRRGAVGALLLSGWASSAIYKSCSDCCQRDVKSSSRPVLHAPCEDQG